MSGFQPRRGPNMNQYIANLNTIPSPQDDVSSQEFGNLEEELALFTNTEFFLKDFDPNTAGADGKNVGFDGAFPLNEFAFVPPRSGDGSSNVAPMQSYDGQARPGQFFSSPVGSTHPHYMPSPPASGSPIMAGDKRPGSRPQSPADGLEFSSRAAAEEDKRRRNTAASARFRVKKKQREQALEKTAKEMSDRADKLESRISELERENKWLRSLVVEKAGSKEQDVGQLLEKVAQETRKGDSQKKGVGTKDDHKAEEVRA